MNALALDRLRRIGAVALSDAELVAIVSDIPQAGLEMGRRSVLRERDPRPRLTSPREVAAWLTPTYGDHHVERFGVLALDSKHCVLGVRVISTGTLDATVAHPRDVFRAALDLRAATVVLFHNHPSGDPTPSPDDQALTTRLVSAGAIMGITVADHIILAGSRYVSLVEAGSLLVTGGAYVPAG